MKLNWGHKLVLFTIVFMGFIIMLVTFMSRERVDLVDQNYYEQGIRYQEEINKYNISDSIHTSIVYDGSAQKLIFSTNLTNIEGTIIFYRASNSMKDFKVPFTIRNGVGFQYPTNTLDKGVWKVIVEWMYNGRKMASEKQIRIE